MQPIQWTPEIIAILTAFAFVCVAIGYLLAAAIFARRAARLSIQLEHSQQALDKSNAQTVELKALLKNAEVQGHQQQLANGRLQEQLGAALATERRLIGELSEKKEALNTLSQKLEETIRQHHGAEKRQESAQAEMRALIKQMDELRERLNQSDMALHAERAVANDLRETLAQRNSQYMKLKTEQEQREASHARELANFEAQKASLTEQFKVVSNEILEAKARSLHENSKITLGAVMSPFQQSIDSFKREVQEIHHRETTQQGELRKELESLKALNQQITAEAHELSTALRGQKKLQGNWGELVLENVLDRSGLQMGKDYKREVSFTTEDGRLRPDAVVYLPQGKHLVIDAKVSLNAYTRYVNAEDEAVRNLALNEHVRAVGDRIRELANRDYYKLPGLNSPEMVFMFIPIESAFVEALKADEGLFQQAIENNVLVATPTTLLTSLNIVRQLWRYEDQNKHTAALANKAEAVFKKLNSFLGSFEKIRKGLENATSSYFDAEKQLVSGKGNLVKQVGDFKNLAPAIKAELPDYFTEKAVLEIDFIPADASGEEVDRYSVGSTGENDQ